MEVEVKGTVTQRKDRRNHRFSCQSRELHPHAGNARRKISKRMSALRSRASSLLPGLLFILYGCIWLAPAQGQTCLTADDMDAPTQTALVDTAKSFFDLAAKGDVAGLRQNATAGLAANFTGIEGAIRDNQPNFAGIQPSVRFAFLLKTEGTATIERAEFLCGVFGPSGQTSNSAIFQIPNLSPRNYGVVTLNVTGAKQPCMVTLVLEQQDAAWKLGGFYVRETQAAGHDGSWFAEQARAFKAKGQLHNAWFYYLQARILLIPVDFMTVRTTDQLYDEAQSIKPSDLPPTDLVAAGKTYKLTTMFPLGVGNDLDLVVKHQVADVSSTVQSYKDNVEVIKALVAKYPELRNAFAGVVARAVEPSGRDYGTMLMMKDIK